MIIRLLLCSLCFGVSSSYADEVIWKGFVDSNGTPSKPIELTIYERYQIKASHYINLGKWHQGFQKLANDACYQFDPEAKISPDKLESLKNSQNISVCRGEYHEDHVYLSEPFVAKQNLIFFWIYDSDYNDNNGAFELEIIHKSN